MLAQLRDIAVPEAPAPGVALTGLITLAAVLLAGCSLYLALRDRRYPWRRAVLAELSRLESLPEPARALPLQQLLRRLGLLYSDEARTAEDAAWLQLLNRQWRTRYFESPEASWMQARYQATANPVRDADLDRVRALICRRTRWPW